MKNNVATSLAIMAAMGAVSSDTNRLLGMERPRDIYIDKFDVGANQERQAKAEAKRQRKANKRMGK